MLDNKMLVLLIIGLLIFYFSKKSKVSTTNEKNEPAEVEESTEKFLNGDHTESGPADFRASEIVNDYEYSSEEKQMDTVNSVSSEKGIDQREYFAADSDSDTESEVNNRNVTSGADTTRPILNNQFNSKLTTMDPNKIPEKKEQKLSAQDYLPKKSDKEWFKDTDIVKLDDSALLKAKPTTFIGVDTVSTSLRNASLDLRGDIPNPKKVVSPWNNTTITTDTNRAKLY
jgi:hypothetical protein